jgi:hypothetical protein
MAAKKRPADLRELSDLARSILQEIKADFLTKGLGAHDLAEIYVGVSTNMLAERYSGTGGGSEVDFDLALKELEDGQFVRTGPWVPFPNEPGSGVVILSWFSKREYMSLTEAGYRVAAQMDNEKPRTSQPRVHISGGTFHQSPIGIGEQVTQVQKIDFGNDADVIDRLMQLVQASGAPLEQTTKAEVTRLVQIAREGNGGEAKPIFQKLFSLGSETVKQTAWGVVSALIVHSLGMWDVPLSRQRGGTAARQPLR